MSRVAKKSPVKRTDGKKSCNWYTIREKITAKWCVKKVLVEKWSQRVRSLNIWH